MKDPVLFFFQSSVAIHVELEQRVGDQMDELVHQRAIESTMITVLEKEKKKIH